MTWCKTHCSPQIVERLFDLSGLFLYNIILDVFKFKKHFLRITLSLFKLFISVFLDSFEMCKKGNLLMFFKSLLSFFYPLINLLCLSLPLYLKNSIRLLFDYLSLLILSLFHEWLFFCFQINNLLWWFEIMFIIHSYSTLLFLHLS